MSWSFFISSRYLLTVSSFLFSIISFFFLRANQQFFFSFSSRSFSENICIDLSYFYLHDILLFLANATNWVNTKSHRLIRPITNFTLSSFIFLRNEIHFQVDIFNGLNSHENFNLKKFFPASFTAKKKGRTILTAVEFRVCQTRNVKRTQSLVGAIKS